MKKLVHYMETEKGKRLKNMLVCFGASIVLLGALFKIMHWPAAGIMLGAGMFTEVFLFAMFGVLPPHKDYHWEKVYTGLDISPELEEHEAHTAGGGGNMNSLNSAISQSSITPELIEGFGKNMSKLGDQVKGLSNLADASVATTEFSKHTREATQSLDTMREAYAQASEAAGHLASASKDAVQYREQMNNATKNLSSLNEMYAMQLNDSGKNAQMMNNFYGNMGKMMQNMEQSVESTMRYREEVASLAQNISSLNSVYGNILSAMATPVR